MYKDVGDSLYHLGLGYVQALIKKFLASAMSQAESSASVVPRHGLFQEHGFEARESLFDSWASLGYFRGW